jgi:hypothetical protein
MVLQLAIAFCTGFLAAVVVVGILIDGLQAYLTLAAFLPEQMAKFAGFWIGVIAGVYGVARAWPALLP